MKLLLDTHVLLWASAAPDQLGPRTTHQLLDTDNDLLVSAVSVAEIEIKRSIGKLTMYRSVSELAEPLGATLIDLTPDDAQALERLPLLHSDPFDRLLAAQSLVRELVLVTADERLKTYPIEQLDANI